VDSLTGIGPGHDDEHVYSYSLDPSTPEGRENLGSIKVMSNTAEYPRVVLVDSTIRGTPSENFHRLLALKATDLVNVGKKECILVVKFRGRFFREERYVLSNTDLYGEVQGPSKFLGVKFVRHYWLDFVPPRATMTSYLTAGHLNNGDTISGTFDYVLDEAGVRDEGYARVSDIRLVVSRCPPALEAVWDYTAWSREELPPVTPADLYANRMVEMEYPIRWPTVNVVDVAWRNIDPSTWPSGKYLMGIVTRDEFGNESFAPVTRSLAPDYQTNPFLVTVTSGRGNN